MSSGARKSSGAGPKTKSHTSAPTSAWAGLSPDQELDDDPVFTFSFEKRVKPKRDTGDLARLRVDTSLQGIDRALYLLRDLKEHAHSEPIRLIAAIELLKQAVAEDAACLVRAVSCLKGAFSTFNGQEKAVIVPYLAGMKLDGNTVLCESLLPWFIDSVKSTTFVDEMLAWQTLILSYVPALSQKAITELVWPLTLASGWMTEKLDTRLFSCRLLKGVADRCAGAACSLPPDYFDVVEGLLSDTHPSVRAEAVEAAARALLLPAASVTIRQRLHRQIVTLLSDAESDVRATALRALASILPDLDAGLLRASCEPLHLAYTNVINSEDLLTEAFCKNFGPVIYYGWDAFTASQQHELLEQFAHMCADRSDDVVAMSGEEEDIDEDSPQRWAAYNFPGVAIVARNEFLNDLNHGTPFAQTTLGRSFLSLMSGPVSVRLTVAKSFHEVMTALGPRFNVCPEGFKAVNELITDPHPRVMAAIMTHLDVLFRNLKKPNESNCKSYISPSYRKCKHGCVPAAVLSNVVAAVPRLLEDWRHLRLLLSHTQASHNVFSPEELNNILLPCLQHLLTDQAVAEPVMLEACENLVAMTAAIPNHKIRLKIMEWQTTELAAGPTSRHRICFVHVCSKVTKFFSRYFFKTFYFEPLLALTEDPILDVRRRVASMLPVMKRMIVLPKDHHLLRQLEAAASALGSNHASDKAWKQFVMETHATLDTINNPITWDLSMLFEDFHIDSCREQEEQGLIEAYEGDQQEAPKDTSKNRRRREMRSSTPQAWNERRSRRSSTLGAAGARRGSSDVHGQYSPLSRRRMGDRAKEGRLSHGGTSSRLANRTGSVKARVPTELPSVTSHRRGSQRLSGLKHSTSMDSTREALMSQSTPSLLESRPAHTRQNRPTSSESRHFRTKSLGLREERSGVLDSLHERENPRLLMSPHERLGSQSVSPDPGDRPTRAYTRQRSRKTSSASAFDLADVGGMNVVSQILTTPIKDGSRETTRRPRRLPQISTSDDSRLSRGPRALS
ncbi:hypothetical protein PTSG_03312 [Salpingoeca rosetta]|uniref:Serine/threonine-protein phosphatase 4 regulatory subunit 4 n=1 Tax=Salpingoeca rosetta (strain ATCC 50818 / BSB-021) TaxID=946362 RepID=F2U4T8_SALR5|nr:uncharacterized protein PTSG_03312 [Salpingoeca rosetta]EGD82654.1 hypothetical protein PTSG_03312 [Salpingoeca rosetta]|eukprot:XP_004995890.1 hypothetical protein PTSG_03312 [Salpingoeca rosetta]